MVIQLIIRFSQSVVLFNVPTVTYETKPELAKTYDQHSFPSNTHHCSKERKLSVPQRHNAD
jgi:hypothetical protein